MAVGFPRTDIMSSVLYEDQTFRLVSRQETSRTAYGRTIAKDLGSAIWMASYTTIAMLNDDALAFEAALNSLDGAIQPFEAGDLRRQNPRAAPDGIGVSDGVLASVTSKSVTLSGLAAGQVVSAGDYLAFDYAGARALHQSVETIAANSAGVTNPFEVRPYVRPGWSLSAAVKLKSARGLFALAPGSVSSKITGSVFSIVSFQAVQVI